ncbi:zinc ABC transporter substrate-binding protein, partial [Candidatus Thioglobus sp.]|uniref:metal ABC transporter solute-binding protein, Zn/Mn family n=1 Tax=Candidatus Thioglobus sp. TaxID=2026721 RepID=UPI00262E3467
EEHEEHSQYGQNYHIWLSVIQMQHFAKKLTDRLVLLDEINSTTYLQNHIILDQKLTALKQTIQQSLNSSRQSIASYSNAFEHFIVENQLNQTTLVTSKHEERLSIYKIIQAKKSMQNAKAKCLVTTTDVPLKRIHPLTEGLKMNATRIDIMGSEFNLGANQYFKLMNSVTSKVAQCLQ